MNTGFSPALRQKLREHDDNNVQKGAAVFDESPGLCDDAPRPCRDVIWAVFFLGTAIAVGAFAVMVSDVVMEEAKKQRLDSGLDGAEEANLFQQAMLACAGAGFCSLFMAILFLEVLKRYTECLVWVALLLCPIMLVFGGLALMMFGWAVDGEGFGLVMAGGIGFLIGICLGTCVVFCWRDMIPFTVLLIQTVVEVMKKHPTMILISIAGSVLAICWSLLVGFAVLGLQFHERAVHENDGLFWSDSLLHGVVKFALCLVYLWGGLVMANVASVACCGVFGRWFFGQDMDGAVRPSLKAAMTTSFGSICFGSFLVATIRALYMVVDMAQRAAAEDGNLVVVLILCVVKCCLDCVGDLVEWFNEFAYVQCAVRGVSFCSAVQATFALCTLSNCRLICADSLVGSVCFLAAMPCMATGAGAAYAICSMMEGHENMSATMALVGMFIGLVVGIAAIRPVQSGSTTFVVCWAEHPEALLLSKPQLAQAFAQRGVCWRDDLEYPDGPLERTPGSARTLAATPMLAEHQQELQTLPSARTMAITVPEGVQAGQCVQCTSPEGTLMQVQVPAGYTAGMQFTAQY